MVRYIILVNADGTEHSLYEWFDFDQVLSDPTKFYLTHDTCGRPFRVVDEFQAASWDEAMMVYERSMSC